MKTLAKSIALQRQDIAQPLKVGQRVTTHLEDDKGQALSGVVTKISGSTFDLKEDSGSKIKGINANLVKFI